MMFKSVYVFMTFSGYLDKFMAGRSRQIPDGCPEATLSGGANAARTVQGRTPQATCLEAGLYAQHPRRGHRRCTLRGS